MPNLVGTWTYTHNGACVPSDPYEPGGYTGNETMTLCILDQEACLFRGYTLEDEGDPVQTNYFTGAIHAARSNVSVRGSSPSSPEISGFGQVNRDATAINNFIVLDGDCADKGKMIRTGPLP